MREILELGLIPIQNLMRFGQAIKAKSPRKKVLGKFSSRLSIFVIGFQIEIKNLKIYLGL